MDEGKSAEQMTVLVVEPGYAPYEKTIPHELHAMQEIVGGLITAIYPYEEPVGIVANDEGLLLGMDFNRSVEGGYHPRLGRCAARYVCAVARRDAENAGRFVSVRWFADCLCKGNSDGYRCGVSKRNAPRLGTHFS